MFYRIATCIASTLLCVTAHAVTQFSDTTLSKLPRAVAIVLLTLTSTFALGGSIRYDLPNLLGQHVYDGNLSLFNAAQIIDTPFGFYEVEEARLVVKGKVSSGQARGDGVMREGTSFKLLPSVDVRPSFAKSIDTTTEPTPETF